jgi:AbiV family abortive infection protein
MVIPEQLWNDLKVNTLAGVIRLLESSEKLLIINDDRAICAGLYTYAVEEYGKLIMLSKYSPLGGKVNLNEDKLFGPGSHKLKFKAAIKNLPDECKNIGIDIWEPDIWEKGIWLDASSVIADFESRMAIFYCGLDKSKKGIEPVPEVGKENLKNAIEKLKTIALGFKV